MLVSTKTTDHALHGLYLWSFAGARHSPRRQTLNGSKCTPRYINCIGRRVKPPSENSLFLQAYLFLPYNTHVNTNDFVPSVTVFASSVIAFVRPSIVAGVNLFWRRICGTRMKCVPMRKAFHKAEQPWRKKVNDCGRIQDSYALLGTQIYEVRQVCAARNKFVPKLK
jgi:hypothetical protein